MQLGGTARSVEDVRQLMAMGLQFAEVSIADPEAFSSKDHVREYQDLLRGSDFFYLCHGPREGNPNDLYSLEHVYLPKLLRILPLVRKLNAKVLTVHLWMDPRFVKQEVIVYKIGFLRRVLEQAAQYQVPVNIENLSEKAGDLAEIFEALPELGFTLDIGHAQLLTSENRSLGFIRRYPERIRHVHIHDNFGGSSPEDDLHLPIGEGLVNFGPIFDELNTIGYRGTITLELRPHEIQPSMEKVKWLWKNSVSSK
ncbi:MAG: sugar phosphate isomerase/epimerase [Deltaproteobacteria bacterium]|nr:sugar phosphate isomerase/epimerase [Deltaproteobacteria bacterium]MBW1930846.1 sugar phosphate isomerase/epimerase [Deltaproteobacteria bacterium]MBW2026725.1 sugar phosphate isomerase/epimerase [Deltaproteobacteria bacterium]MBW2126802.1 sugar phosphate isomerase/epimerase [Deltaproteobacteria bacterium]RLB24655.1 MAG: hypothetical protein DRG76_00770 [Deltaproteobacteria bacterium]